MKIHYLLLLSPLLLLPSGAVANQPRVGRGDLADAAEATCPGFTAADTSGLGAFGKINLQVNCPEGGGSNVEKPSAINWRVSVVEGSALAVSMTPANLLTMKVVNNELSFYLVPENWPGSGDAG